MLDVLTTTRSVLATATDVSGCAEVPCDNGLAYHFYRTHVETVIVDFPTKPQLLAELASWIAHEKVSGYIDGQRKEIGCRRLVIANKPPAPLKCESLQSAVLASLLKKTPSLDEGAPCEGCKQVGREEYATHLLECCQCHEPISVCDYCELDVCQTRHLGEIFHICDDCRSGAVDWREDEGDRNWGDEEDDLEN